MEQENLFEDVVSWAEIQECPQCEQEAMYLEMWSSRYEARCGACNYKESYTYPK